MNKLFKFGMAILAVLVLASCGAKKQTTSTIETKPTKTTNFEGDNVVTKTIKIQGTDMVDELSEDGNSMVKRPYKWYAGIGRADDEQASIELAEGEARATVSRVVESIVNTEMERGALINNGEVQKAVKSHWKQVGTSIQNACELIGESPVEYNPATKMYEATVKVGIRGDRYQQLLNSAGNYKPSNLSGTELQQFIDVNNAIMNAAKGN